MPAVDEATLIPRTASARLALPACRLATKLLYAVTVPLLNSIPFTILLLPPDDNPVILFLWTVSAGAALVLIIPYTFSAVEFNVLIVLEEIVQLVAPELIRTTIPLVIPSEDTLLMVLELIFSIGLLSISTP